MAIEPGSTFAGYRVESVVGRGGMGVVYRAWDVSLDRPVALKLIAPEVAEEERFRSRFLREPRLAASLDHPNVVPIYEAGERDGRLYLAMRYVEGTDLKRVLQQQRALAPEHALRILGQIAGALDVAHRRGLVHRDVKPANVLLDEDENAYLADFGVTKQLGGDTTETGQIVGTLDYLAPEQIRSETVDGRSDCYALACVLYQCLAGAPPFRRDTQIETLWAHLHDEPPELPGYPVLDPVLRKALAKEKDERYASCRAFVEAAGAALGLVGPAAVLAHPVRRALVRRRRAILAGGAVILVVTVAAVIVALTGDGGGSALKPVGNSLVAIDPSTNRIVDQYPVGDTPTTVAVGAGAVWTVNANGQTISRIDTRARTVRTFAIGAVPIDVAASRDAVWAVASDRGAETGQRTQGPATLARLDPRSGGVTDTTTLQPRAGLTFIIPPQVIAADRDAAWVSGRTRRLHRVAARTGQSLVVPGLRVEKIATGDGQVWAFADQGGGSKLVRLDPRTGTIQDRVEVPGGPGPIAVGGGAVWVADAFAGVVWRVDTGGQPVQRTIEVQAGVDSIAFGAGAVWVGNSATGTVSRIDPATNAVKASIGLGNTPRGLVVGEGRVWVTVVGGGGDPVPAAGSLRAGARARPLSERTCGRPLTGSGGDADLLVATDLPLQGEGHETTRSMAAAIAFIMREHRFRAGRFRLALQTCDDSTASGQGPFDEVTCRSNAKAYAANPSVVGVVGPAHSGCSFMMLPILNRAGPVSIVAPNSGKELVRPDPTAPAGELRKLYPTGQRGYARTTPTEDYEVAAAALLAKRLGRGSVFYLEDHFTADLPYQSWFRRAARRIGLRIVGTAVWNAEARSYRRIAKQVRASGVRAVYVLGTFGTNAQQMVKDLRAVLGSNAAIIGYSGLAPIPTFFAEAGAAARGVHVLSGGIPLERVGPAGRRFVRDFGATQPTGRVTVLDLYAAAAAEVLLDAIARSDGTRASVARALAETRLRDSVVGPLAFNRYGEMIPSSIAVVRAERHDRSRPYIWGDLAGGVVEDVIAPPARLVE